MAGFDVGAIVSKLKLDTKGWEASVKKVEKDQKSMTEFAKKHGDAMKAMGRTMTIAGAAILGGIGVAVKAFAGFDKSMTESLAIMGGVSEALRKEMADAAREMSTKSTFAAKELADAYFFLASAGLDAKESIAALPVVTKFAQAGNFQLAQATDLLTDAQSALGLSTDDVVENQKNMVAVSDLLVGANTLANASVQQFAEALTNRAAAALRAVNKPMEEGVAVLAAFADQGRKGSEAGMALDIVLRDLQKAARDNEAEFTKVGVTVFDSTGKLANMGDIIGDLEVLLETMSDKQKGATLTMLGFQERSISNIKTLLGTSDAIKEYQTRLELMAGITDEVSRKQLEAFSNKMTIIKNKLTIVAIEIGEKFAPTIERMAEKIGEVAKKISEWIARHPKLTGTILKVVGALGGLMAVLGPLLMVLPGIIKAVGLMSAKFLAALGPIGLVVGVLALVISRLMTTIDNFKKLKEVEANLAGFDKAANRSAGFLQKFFEAGEKYANQLIEFSSQVVKKYDGDINKALKALEEGTIKRSKRLGELRMMLIGLLKEENKLAEQREKTAENEKRWLELVAEREAAERAAALAAAFRGEVVVEVSKKLIDLQKTLSDELKQATLDEFEFRVEKATELFKEREALLKAEGASEEAFAKNKEALDIKLANIEADQLAQRKKAWEEYFKGLIDAENKFTAFKQEIKNTLDELTLSRFELAVQTAEEERDERLRILEEQYANTLLYDELKRAIEESFTMTKEEILQKRNDTEKAFWAKLQTDEAAFLEAKKAAWHAAFNNIAGTIFGVLNMIGGMFEDLLNIRLNQIAKEEKAKLDAIDKQFAAQIKAANDLLTDEQKKTKLRFAAINKEYDEKKQAIIDNIDDEDERNKALEKLEKERTEALKKAAKEREAAEQAAADALKAIEDEKNEAIRLASEELELKRSAARKKAAKQEKAVALLSAIVNTAAGVAKVFASVGPPASFVLAAITLAAGLVQIALIKSKSVGLAVGGIVTQPTQVLIGEAGPEAVFPIDKLLKAIANKPVGFVSGEGGRPVFSPQGTGGMDVNVTINNYNSFPKEIALNPEALREMIDENEDEVAKDIKDILNRF